MYIFAFKLDIDTSVSKLIPSMIQTSDFDSPIDSLKRIIRIAHHVAKVCSNFVKYTR